MKIGVVTHWFNRGQGIVGRTLAEALESSGYEPHILARRTSDKFWKPAFFDTTADWERANVAPSKSYRISSGELLHWAKSRQLSAVFFDQFYDFDVVKSLAELGVPTIGRFVWEEFHPRDVKPAKTSFSLVYSLTKAEQKRYRDFGIDSPLLNFPALGYPLGTKLKGENYLVFNGGYLSERKPLGTLLQAYKASGIGTPLVVKAQRTIREKNLLIPQTLSHLSSNFRRKAEVNALRLEKENPNVHFEISDLPDSELQTLYGKSRYLVTPSRWEGLGLHAYESLGLGVPCISNDLAPVNEILRNGENAILSESRVLGFRQPGVVAVEPILDSLIQALRLSTDSVLEGRLRLQLSKDRGSRTLVSFASQVDNLVKQVLS